MKGPECQSSRLDPLSSGHHYRMLSKGRTKLCMFKSTWLQSRDCSVLLQRVGEAAVGWGKGLHWQVAGEESKDLVAVRDEEKRDRDGSQVPDQGSSEAHAVNWFQGQKKSIHRPQCLCAGPQLITGSGHCLPANQKNKLSVKMSPLPLGMAYLSSPSTSLGGRLQEAASAY